MTDIARDLAADGRMTDPEEFWALRRLRMLALKLERDELIALRALELEPAVRYVDVDDFGGEAA